MNRLLLVLCVCVGCSKPAASVAPPAQSLTREDVAEIATKAVSDELSKRDAAQRQAGKVAAKAFREQQAAGEHAARKAAKREHEEAQAHIEREKEDARLLLTPTELELVDNIRGRLKRGLWIIPQPMLEMALSSKFSPLLKDDVREAAHIRDPKSELDRLLDSFGMSDDDRLDFALSYDLTERGTFAHALAALHNGTWKGADEILMGEINQPYFREAIIKFRRQKK